eukprot:EG_transcript_8089
MSTAACRRLDDTKHLEEPSGTSIKAALAPGCLTTFAPSNFIFLWDWLRALQQSIFPYNQLAHHNGSTTTPYLRFSPPKHLETGQPDSAESDDFRASQLPSPLPMETQEGNPLAGRKNRACS